VCNTTRLMVETRSPIMRWLYGAIAIAVTSGVLFLLRGVLTPIFFAFLLAYLLNPVVTRLESWRIPRALAIVILLASVLLGIAAFVLLVLPGVVRDIAALANELPSAMHRLLEVAEPWLKRWGIEIPKSTTEFLERYKNQLPDWANGALLPVGNLIKAILGQTVSVLGAIAALVLVPIFTFYLLQDFNRIIRGMSELIPINARLQVLELFREVDRVLGQFVRGQLTVMTILAALYAAAYEVIGVRLALPIGIVAGLLSFIPYVGGAIALGLALLMVGLHYTGWIQLISVIVAYGLIQALEGFVITPRIVGEKLGLAPVWVLVALMVGGELFGFMGVMLALPASAVIKVLVVRGVISYKNGSFYRGEAAFEPRVRGARSISHDASSLDATRPERPKSTET
ncbi:MAG: AI-2E family transporter, partial [Deltaproteobacteria bacterium]|nr:AI-2E family transporter [Deltaproteobacteria bacterium]